MKRTTLTMTAAFAATVDRFLATLAPGAQVRAASLYDLYLRWAAATGGPALTSTAFGRCAAASGRVLKHRMGSGLGYTVQRVAA